MAVNCPRSVELPPSEFDVKPLLLCIYDSSEAEVSERLVVFYAPIGFFNILGGF